MARTRKYCSCLYYMLGFYKGQRRTFPEMEAKLRFKTLVKYTRRDSDLSAVDNDKLVQVEKYLTLAKTVLCDSKERASYDSLGQNGATEHDCPAVIELLHFFKQHREHILAQQKLEQDRAWEGIVREMCPHLLQEDNDDEPSPSDAHDDEPAQAAAKPRRGRRKNASKIKGELVRIINHRNREKGMTCTCLWTNNELEQSYNVKLDKLIQEHPTKVREYLAELKEKKPRKLAGLLENEPNIFDRLAQVDQEQL